MNYKIKVQNLCFGYNEDAVLKDIDVEFPSSGFISIVGPNGSGKSTLLKHISGVLKPISGNVLLDDMKINIMRKKDISQIISVVPQNTALEFDYKVMDVVMMGRYPYIGRFKGETRQDRDIAIKNMEFTNTYHLRDRSFNQLSGGERQRVILAQALAQQPRILLLDEPIAHLDMQHQIEIMNLIKKLTMEHELTVIAVLHDLNIASAYSDHIIMLKDGRISCQGNPAEAFTPQNIKKVFGITVEVEVSSLTNKPYIYAITRAKTPKNNVSVHVICGGGSGSEVISSLVNSGFNVSTGVLSIGDMDWKISKDLDLELAEDIPFASISDEAFETNKRLAVQADYVIMTDFFVGKGNIRNLEVLLESETGDKPILILGDESFKTRDITEGIAEKLYNNIKSKNSSIIVTQEQMYSILNKAGMQDEN